MSEVILPQNLSGFSSAKFGAVLLPPIIIIHLEGSSHPSSLFGVKPPMNLSVSDFFFFSACLSFAPLSSFSLVHPLFFFFTFPPPTSTRLSSTPLSLFLVLFLKSSFPLPLFTLWSAPVICKSSVPPTSRFSFTSF